MNLFGGVITVTGITYMLFCVFAIIFIGYALGRINIKGVDLGTAGVFIVALIYGCLFYGRLEGQMGEFTKDSLKVIENVGLIMFVSTVGFIAGPKFFSNIKNTINYKVSGENIQNTGCSSDSVRNKVILTKECTCQ